MDGKECSERQSDGEPEGTRQKEAGVCVFTDEFPLAEGIFLGCIWYFLSSCKHSPPRSNRGHFCRMYLQRERCAGENRILVQEDTVLLEKLLSGLSSLGDPF